jgi:hypothetical protein
MGGGKPLTQEIVESRLLNHGFRLKSPFTQLNNKHIIECRCGKEWACKLDNAIRKGSTISCGHCNDPVVGDRFNCFTITKIKPRTYSCSVEAVCDCGRIWTGYFANIKNGHLKSCGHCNDPKINDRFAQLIVTHVSPCKHPGCNVIALCDCGREWSGKGSRLTCHSVKSCGHCSDPKVGDIVGDGKWEILEVIPSESNGCSVRAKCRCGNIWTGRANKLRNNSVNSCGCQCGKNSGYTRNQLKILVQQKGMIFKGEYDRRVNTTRDRAKFECPFCHKDFIACIAAVLSGSTVSCGCQRKLPRLTHENVFMELKKKNILLLEQYKGLNKIHKMKCSCSRVFFNKLDNYINNTNYTCDHCNDVEIGQKIGTLMVIQKHQNSPRRQVTCVCICGRLWRGNQSLLTSGNSKSCGKCGTFRNGTRTSELALGIHSDLFANQGEHNANIFSKSGKKMNVDIFFEYNGTPIVCEIDPFFTHGHPDHRKRDKIKHQRIVRATGKLLIIKLQNEWPTQEQVDKAIDKLVKTDQKQVTIRTDWYGKCRDPNDWAHPIEINKKGIVEKQEKGTTND